MSILDNFLTSTGPGVIQQLTKQFGLDGNQATSALSTLVPMLAGGLKDKLAAGGATGLTDLISGTSFQQFANDPASLGSPAAIEQGKSLLGQIFGGGSGALSDITNKTAEATGLGSSVVGTMLPVVASLLMGFVSKSAAADPNNTVDMVTSLAGGGGIVGTLKGLASKVFG